jgi:hypothetical protein
MRQSTKWSRRWSATRSGACPSSTPSDAVLESSRRLTWRRPPHRRRRNSCVRCHETPVSRLAESARGGFAHGVCTRSTDAHRDHASSGSRVRHRYARGARCRARAALRRPHPGPEATCPGYGTLRLWGRHDDSGGLDGVPQESRTNAVWRRRLAAHRRDAVSTQRRRRVLKLTRRANAATRCRSLSNARRRRARSIQSAPKTAASAYSGTRARLANRASSENAASISAYEKFALRPLGFGNTKTDAPSNFSSCNPSLTG